MKSAINWFEIPSNNFDKAIPFYEQTLGVTLKREVFADVPHAIFPADRDKGIAGALVARAANRPGASGVVIYLNAPDGVEACLARAQKAGATVVLPNTSIGPQGWIGLLKDLDGNVIGLHSV